MSKLNRRTFLRLLGQGTAALGVGLSGKALAQTGGGTTLEKFMTRKYQTFKRGEYLDWEKEVVEERLAIAAGKAPKTQLTGGFAPVIAGTGGPDVVKEEDLIFFNHQWDPYNPLFNDEEYAQKAGYQDIPALPGFKGPGYSDAMALTIPNDMGDKWYYAHGPNDMEFFAPIYAGDSFTSKSVGNPTFEDTTVDGSNFRKFAFKAPAEMYNLKGDLIVRGSVRLRNGYKKFIDGSPKPSFTEMQTEWTKYFPRAHVTTDEEWEYIKELWDKEYIRGSQKLYWEDVKVGDEPAWICSGPISHMDMIGWYGQRSHDDLRDQIKKGAKELFHDPLGQYYSSIALHLTGRNIPGSRMVFYNDTAAKHVTRLVTNYIGDAGFVTRIGWMFQQLYKEFQDERVGGEYLDLVPYMKGKGCTVHGGEGDTVIGKGYVTKKYKNDKGEGIIDLTCWAETLDNRIIEVVPASAKLPLKKG